MKRFRTAFVIVGFVLSIAGSALAQSPAQNFEADDEHQGLRCRRVQRAVQLVVATEGYESSRLKQSSATVRKPRRVVRDVIGYSVKSRSVGRSCFRCISGQIRRRVPLVEQEACGYQDPCIARSTCPSCSHDVCEAGAALQPACDSCTAAVCSVDPFCCDTLWSEDCVAKVETICGNTCGAPAPTTSTTLEATTTTLLASTTTLETTDSTLPTTTTTLPAEFPADDDVCIDIVDFEGERAGKIVAQVTTARGRPVVVKGTNPRFDCKKNAAVIYDSACSRGKCTAGDTDLGTPNEDFDGPGEGKGGEEGSPSENSTARGNVLIIADNLRDADSDGLVDNPGDQAWATVIHEFDFSAFAPTTVRGLTLIDVEDAETPASIEIFDMTGASLGSFPVPTTGDNGVVEVDLPQVGGVWKLIVTLRGSSAIDEIRLGCATDGTTTTTTTTLDVTTTTSTTTTLPIGESLSCPVSFAVDSATNAFALQFEATHDTAPGGFLPDSCTVVPDGLVDVNADGDTVEIGWADSTGSGFTGPGAFAACTFVSTSGAPVPADFSIEILDCSGPNPPTACSPAAAVSVAVGACAEIAPVCGNGVLESGEDCDDGNVQAGDGCGSLCTSEGTTTTSTTLDTTTTTLPTTTTTSTTTTLPTTTTTTTSTTTTLPPTTTTTTSSTTSSTTTTTLPQGFDFACTLTVRVTSTEQIGSLKWVIDYADTPGGFTGTGLGVGCTSLVTGASKSFFDDETNRVLRESVISLSGFSGPIDIATCPFETNDNGLVPANFPLEVQDATTPDLIVVNPTVVVSSVQCAPASLGVGINLSPRIPEMAPNGPVF
jgi:cysteine-rich repeat protein